MKLTRNIFTLSRNVKTLAILSNSNVKYFQRANHVSNKNFIDSQFYSKLSSISTSIPTDIQSFLQKNKEEINGSDIVAATKNLLRIYELEKINPKKLQNYLFFRNVCNLIDSNVEKLEINKALQILKILNELQVPSSSKVVSSLLKQIDALIITSNVKYFNILSEILSKIKPTATSRKVSDNLNKKFMLKITKDFDDNDIQFITEALKYACKHKLDNKVISSIFHVLQTYDLTNIQTTHAITIIKSFFLLNEISNEWKDIYLQVQNCLLNNIDELSKYETQVVCFWLTSQTKNNRDEIFYNSMLYDKIAEKVIKNNLKFDEVIIFLSYFNRIRHTNKNLLNYISAVYYEEYTLKKNIPSFFKLLVVLTGLAYVRYRPIFWNDLYKDLLSEEILQKDAETLIIYSLNLASLNCYNLKVLQKIFELDYSSSKSGIQWSLSKLWQMLQRIPEYNGPHPSEKLFEIFKANLIKKREYPLYCSLEKAVGGSKYIKTNVQSQFYHQLDHVVVFRNGETPVVINEANDQESDEKVDYIEDLSVSDDCQIIVINNCPSNWFLRNTSQLIGSISAADDYLKSLSCNIVRIPFETWYKMPEESKVPYLLNEIKSTISKGKKN